MAVPCIILMGVSGTGKTSVGMALARALNAKFLDGDDLHPRENILKMAAGQALNDEDRLPWLTRISDVIFSLGQKNEAGVLVCSALKKRYRDTLRAGYAHVRFIWLQGDYQFVLNRMRQRQGHFMPEALLQSQFATLEVPGEEEGDVIPVDISPALSHIVSHCISLVSAAPAQMTKVAS